MLARRLLAQLGHPDHDLLPDTDRVPIWPTGVVGSISHKDDLCVVVVSRERDRSGLGVDVEQDQPPKPGLERMVCTPAERHWLEAVDSAEAGRRCRAIFAAKEAVYKAFFPRLREVWGFQDVELEIDLEAESFRAALPAGAPRSSIDGRLLRRAGWILAGVEDA
jgi:4'-phosphopantetheinyl transferase EntD